MTNTYGVERKVGERVTYAGFDATIVRVLDYAPTMVEIRLARGAAAVSLSDLRPARASVEG